MVRFSALLLTGLSFLILAPWASAEGGGPQGVEEYRLGEVRVTAEGGKSDGSGEYGLTLSPHSITVDLDDFQMLDEPQNIGDIVKELIIADFRGKSDLVPDNDSFHIRGFEAYRFVTAVDGLDLRKTGGFSATNIVDYTYLPPFLVEKVEIMPGPHWALYPAKSIGGVLNLITRAPQYHEELKPSINVTTSYGSYNTQNHSAYVQGGVKSLAYDLGYQKYSTDGYLRNSDADIDTVFGRIGYVLPGGGHLSFTTSFADADRQTPVKNDPSDPTSDYDDAYPTVSTASWRSWQDPSWDSDSFSFRLGYRQPTPVGNLSADAYYGEENREIAYFNWVDAKDHSKGATRVKMADTTFYSQGGKLQDEIRFSDSHTTTLALDLEQLYDGNPINYLNDKEKRIELFGAGIQHKWQILSRLALTAGMRFEDVNIWVANFNSTGAKYITGRPDWIEREWNGWLPKSFLTYELDDIAAPLRDTSVSLGVSRIWRAPDWTGDINPAGRPAGAWLEPEHGVGLDAILVRRLFGNISMRLNYFYYDIEDYISNINQFAVYTPSRSNRVAPGMEYKDWKLNLDGVVRQGIELEFNGRVLDRLSFYLGYAFQDFKSKGDEPAGEMETDDIARHRVKAGLRYNLFKNTMLLLDYQYQDKQVILQKEQISTDDWVFRTIPIDDFQLLDLGVQQTLFEKWGPLGHGLLRVYVKNLFDEEYQSTNPTTGSYGYPGTDRTFGFALSFSM